MVLLENKSEDNSLGFAVLLKFFQMEARYPRSKQEVPKQVVCYIAQLLGVSSKLYKEYSFSGRTFERHRAEIRSFLGWREFTVEDASEFTNWLCEKVLVYERQSNALEAAFYQRLRELKLEPPTPQRIERLIRSAIKTTEKKFCTGIFKQLSFGTLRKMDILLKTRDGLDDDPHQFKQSVFNFLKQDPGRTSLKSILKEIEKLLCIRDLGIPTKLFANVPPKIIAYYRRRASVETQERTAPSPCFNSLHPSGGILLLPQPRNYG